MDIYAQIEYIGSILTEKGLLTQQQIDEILQDLAQNPASDQADFEDMIIEKGHTTESDLLQVYADFLGMSVVDLESESIDRESVTSIPVKFANKHNVIAIKKEGDLLTVAVRNPFEIEVIDELKTFTELAIIPVIATKEQISAAIKEHYGTGAATVEVLVQDNDVAMTEHVDQVAELDELGDDASMVNYVNQLLLEACEERATDIHIEPFKEYLRVRYRIDGILHEAKTPPDIKKLHGAIISRLKVMANLNISEKRTPQDGRARINLKDRDIDLRLATYPTLFGEGMSIRLLSGASSMVNMEELGFEEEDLIAIRGFLKKTNGIILVTGPTGSGKTTSLYSCLNDINKSNIRIVTLEDPIEYQLDGVNQIQVNNKVDLTFANGFRSILRQDPDVILVGEIRDSETAQIAIRAALTGHLILSTLHTNNALATIDRLLDLGIEPYLLTNTLRAIIAQRLVRRVCPKCKEEYQPEHHLLEAMGVDVTKQKGMKFYRGKGCAECGETGYLGRMALYELLTVDEKLSALIETADSRAELKKQADVAGMNTLRQDGLRKAMAGLTTIDEVLRVTE